MSNKTQQTPAAVKTQKTSKGGKDKPAPETKVKSKKTAKPAAEKKTRRTDGLKAWQIRILQALNKSNHPLSRSQISEKARTHPSNQTNAWGIGLADPVKRAAAEKKYGFPSLLTLKYVKESEIEVNGRTVSGYSITAAGKAALTKIKD